MRSTPRTSSSPMAAPAGLALIELLVIVSVIALLIGILLPALGAARRTARQMQNNTQLRGIHQGLFTFAQTNKIGGRDGWYPGLSSEGKPRVAGVDDILAGQLAADAAPADVAVAAPADAAGGETYGTDKRNGFIVYAFASLAAGDFIPGGSAGYFLNPADTVKSAFVAGGIGAAGTFDASKISYATLDVTAADPAAPNATESAYKGEWRETINTRAIVLSDRMLGTPTAAPIRDDPFAGGGNNGSVWTDAGGGRWRGSLVRNDGSTSFEASPAFLDGALKYSRLEFNGGDTFNVFSTAREVAPERIPSANGSLIDTLDGPGGF